MKATLPLLFLLATSLAADDKTSRYLVSTNIDAAELARPFPRAVAFRAARGFAADLTPGQVAELRRSPHVTMVEPDAERYLLASPRATQMIPYGVAAVRAPEVWPRLDGAGVRVGILDTGVDVLHEDLVATLKGGYDFINDDTVPDDESPPGPFTHGTLMAGTIAAARNGFGIVGVAPDAELYALKVFGKDGIGYASDIIEGIDWAIANGMQILNCSFGGPTAAALEEEAYRRAAQANILLVAATGNHGSVVMYPAAYDSVLAVGAVDELREIAPFSNFGPAVDLVAPGVGVLSTSYSGFSTIAGVTLADGTWLDARRTGNAPHGELSGRLVAAGFGRADEFPADAAGAIVLLQRGEIGWSEKLHNARAAGAIAAIVATNGPNACREADDAPLLALCIAGDLLDQRVGETIVLGVYRDDYFASNGTSMSAPHVSGVAALLWSLAPAATATEIRDALTSTARDLGPQGWDEHYGHGLVDAAAAARRFEPARRRRATRH